MAPPPPPNPTPRFRFAGVELDTANHSLRVDGRPCACSRKAFELLRHLCAEPNRVLTRHELSEALWPGGQVISDEALTQVIFRARAVLGPHGAAIVTVRGVGLRLAVPVERIDQPHDGEPAAVPSGAGTQESLAPSPVVTPEPNRAPAPEPSPATPTSAAAELPTQTLASQAPGSGRLNRLRRAQWLAGLALLALLLAVVRQMPATDPQENLLDPGYGLTQEDLHAERADTPGLIREAFENDARGERARGISLLTAVHASDAKTPIPAMFLALWSAGIGDKPQAQRWLDAAGGRVATARSVYLNLLFDYVRAETNGPAEDALRHAGAILDIRTGAWRMRQARSHLLSAQGLREAALREIQQIEVRDLGHRKLELVIADRASLGDVAGAQAQLDALRPQVRDTAAFAFLSGRVAWSREDFEAAHAFFEQAAALAFDTARADLEHRALANQAAIDVIHRRDTEAIERLERARSRLDRNSQLISELDLSLFLAELHADAGRAEHVQRELERARVAAATADAPFLQQVLGLVERRLQPLETQSPRPPRAGEDYEALWQARLAFNRGDTDSARSWLTDATRRGILRTRFIDEARWLAAELGEPVPPGEAMDPPYPPISRAVLRRAVREALAAKGQDPGPLRP